MEKQDFDRIYDEFKNNSNYSKMKKEEEYNDLLISIKKIYDTLEYFNKLWNYMDCKIRYNYAYKCFIVNGYYTDVYDFDELPKLYYIGGMFSKKYKYGFFGLFKRSELDHEKIYEDQENITFVRINFYNKLRKELEILLNKLEEHKK